MDKALERVAAEVMRNQPVMTRSQDKLRQAAVDQYLSSTDDTIQALRRNDGVPVAGRTRSRTAAHSALEASIAAAATFDTKQLGARQLSSRSFPESIFATALAVMCTDTGKLMKYRELLTHRDPNISRDWKTSSANEFRRLIDKTKTCRFVSKGEVPLD